jgi:hypothetical protein
LVVFWVRVKYRLVQFWQMVTAGSLPAAAVREITAVLTPAEFALYQRYSPTDQQHTYQVLLLLRQAGHTHPALQTAALLHDVGKTCVPINIIERSLAVLAYKLLPRQTAVWGQGEANGWKRPFVVKMQHPRWGAELAQAAGSDSLTVWLMAQHQTPLPPPAERDERWQLLAQLQWADDQT